MVVPRGPARITQTGEGGINTSHRLDRLPFQEELPSTIDEARVAEPSRLINSKDLTRIWEAAK